MKNDGHLYLSLPLPATGKTTAEIVDETVKPLWEKLLGTKYLDDFDISSNSLTIIIRIPTNRAETQRIANKILIPFVRQHFPTANLRVRFDHILPSEN